MRAWWIVALVFCACPVPEPEPEDWDGGVLPDGGLCPQELVVTTLDGGSFTILGANDPLVIEAGPQGGWHVWVGAHTTGLPPFGTLNWTLKSGAGSIADPLSMRVRDAATQTACGWDVSYGRLGFAVNGEPWRGRTAELEARWEATGREPLVVKRTVRLE